MRKTKQQTTKYLNSIFRARGRSLPSSRGSRRFVLDPRSSIWRRLEIKHKCFICSAPKMVGSNLRKIPQYTIQIFGISLLTFLFTNNVSALDYQNSTNVQFTFNPTLSLTISDNLTIDNLSPGTYSDSNIINISVATNNVTGYNLSATVGSSSNNTTNLTHSTSGSNAPVFTSLSTNASCTVLDNTCDNEHANIWGYSYSDDNGSTWSNYSGLPPYTNPTGGTILNYKNNPSEDSIKFKIGALASNTQASGTYTNTINFTAITNPETHYYIQDFTLSQCEQLATNDHFTVYDKRDENDYTVRYINGECWMTQNLRITGTISAQYSNFEGEDFNVSEYSLDANDASYANHCNNSNGFNNTCSKTSDSTEIGTWYNYYAATAGTISSSSNTNFATQDICPIGWHLPSGPNTTADTDYNKLIGNTISDWQDATTGLTAFNAIVGGGYFDGILNNTGYGYWWSANNYTSSARIRLVYDSNTDRFNSDLGAMRYRGYSIRCVRSS